MGKVSCAPGVLFLALQAARRVACLWHLPLALAFGTVSGWGRLQPGLSQAVRLWGSSGRRPAGTLSSRHDRLASVDVFRALLLLSF
jgi:hypothetical protein